MKEFDGDGEAVGGAADGGDSGTVVVRYRKRAGDGVSIGDSNARNVGGGGAPAVGAVTRSTAGRLD